MTEAPASIVAMSKSCPGQSTKETCLTNYNLAEQNLQVRVSGADEELG